MVIRLHRGQLRWFRWKAKRAYPLETMALLVGRRLSPQAVGISYFCYPELKVGEDRVRVPVRAYEDACELANSEGLHVVGTLHSHCDALPMMSLTDKASHLSCGDLVSGILTILASGKTALEFWQAGDCVALKVEYYR